MRQDPKSKSSRKVAFASFIGTTIEWYDFYLYGISAALIFDKLFFPQFSRMVGIMAAYATYAIGFFARPLGGFIFGHYGDRLGRKNMLVLTLSIMGFATFLIGLLPTYYQIGIFSPILLVILRCLQGIGVGGEWGGSIVMTAEHSREKERGFYSSWPNAAAPFGLFISIIVYIIFSSLPYEEFLSWGWRIPYLLGSVIVGVGLFIRLQVLESPLFAKILPRKKSKVPALELIRHSIKNFLLAMGARFAESVSFYIFTVFILSYATDQLLLPQKLILSLVMIAVFIETISIPIFGRLSDFVGRRPVYLFGAIIIGLFSFPFFWLLQTKSIPWIIIAIVFGLSIGHAAMHGPQPAFFSELFKTRFRYSGVAIAYHVSAAFSGGLAPLIATGLVAWTGGHTWPVSVYMILMSLITIFSVSLAKETAQKKINS